MNRRSFFGLLAGLVAAPFVPKKKAETVRLTLNELPLHTSGFVQAVPAFPTGSFQSWYGDMAPQGWLACNGQVISQEAYPALYNAIGQIYSGTGPQHCHSVADPGHSHFIPPDPKTQFRLPPLGNFIIKT